MVCTFFHGDFSVLQNHLELQFQGHLFNTIANFMMILIAKQLCKYAHGFQLTKMKLWRMELQKELLFDYNQSS